MARLRIAHWLSVMLGFALGLAVGLLITWQLWPVEYYNTDPVDLRAEHKEDYVVMIAASYAQDDDLELAVSRMAQLGLEDSKQMVLQVFQAYAEASRAEESHSLARLAYDLGVKDVALLPYVLTPTATAEPIVSPTMTPTSEASAAPTPTEAVPEATPTPTELPVEDTPTPTESPPALTATPVVPPGDVDFQLVEQQDLGCGSDWGDNYILVYAQDEHGRGLAGIQLVVSGPEGEDSFFTGLKPEVDPGFADFLVTSPGTYSVQVQSGTSEVAEGIGFGDACPAESPYRAWRVAFRRTSQ